MLVVEQDRCDSLAKPHGIMLQLDADVESAMRSLLYALLTFNGRRRSQAGKGQNGGAKYSVEGGARRSKSLRSLFVSSPGDCSKSML